MYLFYGGTENGKKGSTGNPIDQGEMEVLARIFEAKKIPFVMITENDSYINYVSDTVEDHGIEKELKHFGLIS